MVCCAALASGSVFPLALALALGTQLALRVCQTPRQDSGRRNYGIVNKRAIQTLIPTLQAHFCAARLVPSVGKEENEKNGISVIRFETEIPQRPVPRNENGRFQQVKKLHVLKARGYLLFVVFFGECLPIQLITIVGSTQQVPSGGTPHKVAALIISVVDCVVQTRISGYFCLVHGKV
ncbi:hypothetical protein CORC01_13690 [Colletotrichum orchidophilum]|uniref:Secreted protein n=1 Tax=Colletotrichum orchidophilum TaxID=1209926 RepID=A0A1G4APB2_9PEZI|nr:uncharacterized protein CORC01_13690 [Colletotrichum orchidophilum]OHE91009.1 hypothetical protein CORC01_13690 [Colletotrichum orchidophilum]